jgi:hypothetical protein
VLLGHIFRAFWSHILRPVAWKWPFSKHLLRFLGFKVMRSYVLWTELLFILCTEVQYWLREVRLVLHMVFICCVCSGSVG